MARPKRWLYFPDSDKLLEKNEFTWSIPYQMSGARTWTVLAESVEDARATVDSARERGEFD